MIMDKKDFLEYDAQIVQHPKNYTNKSILLVRCIQCKKNRRITLEKYYARRKKGRWICKDCIMANLAVDPVYKNRFRQLHSRQDYKARVHNEKSREKISARMKELWVEKYDEWVAKRRTKSFRERISKWSKKFWKGRKRDEK